MKKHGLEDDRRAEEIYEEINKFSKDEGVTAEALDSIIKCKKQLEVHIEDSIEF
jgi:hypothetical protein